MIDKDSLPLDKPRRTPDHPTKSHVVKTRVDGKEKVIRFGEQGASTAGKPKEGESERMKAKRASFKSRHAKNIAKGKSSPAYWANKVKWATGGSVGLEDLEEKYEGIKKPDFKMLDSFKDLVRTLQSRAEDAGDQEFDAVRALGRTGAAGSLEDLYAAYADKRVPHAARAEAGAVDPDRAKTAKMVFDSFKSAGFSDAQAKALTAEINREGSLNPAYLYGTHTDAANRATNVGMLSWQGDRANRLMSFMADRGLIDPAGNITPGRDALNAQAEYLRWEMENDPSYAKTRETFLGNPNIDLETAHDVLGKNFIRWRIDDPKYRGSGFDRIYEGYNLLNTAQGYKEGGKVEADEDELERAIRLRDLELMAEPRNPKAVSAQDPSLLNVGGIGDRLALINQTFNPVEAIGGAMRAGSDLMAPEAGGYDRLEALGRMLSGVAGVAGPAAVAKRAGAPAASAVMESLLGASPTSEALAEMGRKYAVDEYGGMKLYRGDTGSSERITGGIGEGLLFGTPYEDVARLYGDNINQFELPDSAKVLTEGSKEFSQVTGRKKGPLLRNLRPGENLTSAANEAIERAQAAGYDAVEFNSMRDLGVAVLNPNIVRAAPTDPAIKRAEEVLFLLKSGRAEEVTDEMLDMRDPVLNARLNEYLYRNYDLPMDYESRMARAAEMGALDEYHGTTTGSEMRYPRADFGSGTRKGTGFFTSSNPYVASSYADPSYGSVFPMMNTTPPSGLASVDVGGKLWSQIPADTPVQVGGKTRPVSSYAARFIDGDPVDFYRTDDIARGAAVEGDGGVVFKNMLDRSIHAPNPPGEPSVIREFQTKSSEPSTVTSRQDTRGMRSRFARFDPRLAHLRNLSAGVAAGAIGASQYDPDAIETTAARVRENKFASGGIVRYDPAAVDSIINKLREVNRG